MPDTQTARWQPGTFLVPGGFGEAPARCHGYTWRGLALHHSGWVTPRIRTEWTLTHIGSGLPLFRMIGNLRTVMPVASEVAECSDFTLFDLPLGWMQTDPDLRAKVLAIMNAHPEVKPLGANEPWTTHT